MWIDDEILRQSEQAYCQAVWEPQHTIAVLGSSNKAEAECDVTACTTDGIEILRRYGGGGAVVLHPGCVVLSVGTWVRRFYHNNMYFQILNQAVVDCLAQRWPELEHLSQRGISDICMGEKKIVGTSMFRSRNYLLYQASILVRPRLEVISRYLKHPTKEPDYRQGRNHEQFLIGLADASAATTADVVEQLQQALPGVMKRHLVDEAMTPMTEQIPHLLRRANDLKI